MAQLFLGYAKDHFFDGSLDDLRIYNSAFTTEEVNDLYYYTEVVDSSTPSEPAPSGGTVDLTVFSSDSYGDGWNGGEVLITDSNGDTVIKTSWPSRWCKIPSWID